MLYSFLKNFSAVPFQIRLPNRGGQRHFSLIASILVGTLCATAGSKIQTPGLRVATRDAQAVKQTQLPAQKGVIRVQVNLVPVDVIATNEDGRPVTDLRKEDFRILENGREQEIRHFSIQTLTPRRNQCRSRPQPARWIWLPSRRAHS